MDNKPKLFTVFQTHEIKFDFMERIRILFGKKVTVYGRLKVDKEVKVISGTGNTEVERIIRIRNMGISPKMTRK